MPKLVLPEDSAGIGCRCNAAKQVIDGRDGNDLSHWIEIGSAEKFNARTFESVSVWRAKGANGGLSESFSASKSVVSPFERGFPQGLKPTLVLQVLYTG
jgi:DNA mismatch repair protein MutH